MATALRLFRILVSTVVCIVLLTVVAAFFSGLLMPIFTDGSVSLSNASRAIGWDLAFRAPRNLFVGTVPLTAIAFLMDRMGLDRWWYFVILWVIAGIVGYVGPGVYIAGPVIGALYWLLAGRMAGKPGLDLSRLAATPRRMLNLAGYAGLAYFAFVILSLVFFGGKMLWVTLIEPSPGTPPFATEYGHQMTTRMKVAMLDFPDPAACLESGASAGRRDDLKRLDWGRIETYTEATVCIFRLLGSYGDISASQDWLEAQGFRMSGRGFNVEEPYTNRDGTLRVDAGWSIRENGPKFPTFGPFRRAFYSIPYSMVVYTTWSSDGQTLLYVNLGANTL